MPASCRRTRGSSPKPSRGRPSSRTSRRSPTTTRRAHPRSSQLLKEIDSAGYSRRWQVLNAADFGVPHARPRLIIVGTRKRSKTPELPEPTHSGQWERRASGAGEQPYVTTGQDLSDLVTVPEQGEIVRGRWSHLLAGVPPGENYLYFTEKRGHPDPIFEWRSRYWSFLLKLDPAKPAPTIQAQPGPNVGPFHWENRRLRILASYESTAKLNGPSAAGDTAPELAPTGSSPARTPILRPQAAPPRGGPS
ncbi:MAG: DNA cytosine methyltransferase [Acidimicrobiales bacterium]